jgi:hypothetical protein
MKKEKVLTKQTAVEWLIYKIYNHPENPLDAHIEAYFKEAKQMEKEKMIDFAEISRIKKIRRKQMKNIIKLMFIALLTFTFFYLLGAFYSASLDISMWNVDARFSTILFGGLFSAASIIGCLAIDDIRKEANNE